MSYISYLRRRAAAEYLREQRGIPCSEKTLAKLACIGGGPIYRLFGRIPLYTSVDLDAYADSKLGKPVRSNAGMCKRAFYPSSNVVTPYTRCKETGRIGPEYIRAVSNTGANPCAVASARASSFGCGTSRNT
jgi:hypothetical protein